MEWHFLRSVVGPHQVLIGTLCSMKSFTVTCAAYGFKNTWHVRCTNETVVNAMFGKILEVCFVRGERVCGLLVCLGNCVLQNALGGLPTHGTQGWNNCAAGNDVKAFFQALDAESCKSLCREFLNFANGSYINVCLLHKFTTVSFCCVTPVPNKPPIVAYRLQFNSISIQLSWGNRGVGACISVDLALDKRSCRFR